MRLARSARQGATKPPRTAFTFSGSRYLTRVSGTDPERRSPNPRIVVTPVGEKEWRHGAGAGPHKRLEPNSIYRALADDGPITLFGGDVRVTFDGTSHQTFAEIELEEGPGGPLVAHIAGNQAWIASALDSDSTPSIALVGPEALDPPDKSALAQQGSSGGWAEGGIPIGPQTHGDPALAECFVAHIASPLRRLPFVRVGEGGLEGIEVELPGWRVRLMKRDDPSAHAFTHLARCHRLGGAATAEDLERLRWRLHILLGFVSGHEVNIGPVAGLDANGSAVFATWGAGRDRDRTLGVYWRTEPILGNAIQNLSVGFGRLVDDEALLRVVDRGIGHLLAASAQSEVLDIRIPIACTDTELIAWATLQRLGWLGLDALQDAGGKHRSAPAQVVWHCSGSARFVRAPERPHSTSGPCDWSGPEVLFSIRNALVHPPTRLDEPEWPSSDELLEAWQLATWYLELAPPADARLLRPVLVPPATWTLDLGRRAVPWSQ